jgi:hypothetical protein
LIRNDASKLPYGGDSLFAKTWSYLYFELETTTK